jgi:cob(I)alamin adenosyltransferase
MTKRNAITTKKGDQGFSRLFSGEKISKNSPRLEAIGDVDELISILGLARCYAQRKETKETILALQRALFIVGAELATAKKKFSRLPRRIDQDAISRIEALMDFSPGTATVFKGFVLPGNTPSSTYLDYARSVARRCERKAVGLFEAEEITNKHLIVWLNRLSDCLYLMARSEEDSPTYLNE